MKIATPSIWMNTARSSAGAKRLTEADRCLDQRLVTGGMSMKVVDAGGACRTLATIDAKKRIVIPRSKSPKRPSI